MEKSIVAWQKKTFPKANEKAIRKKLKEEVKELLKALNSNAMITEILVEVSDIFIVAAFLANKGAEKSQNSVSLTSTIKWKMRVNKARKWGKEDCNGDRKREK